MRPFALLGMKPGATVFALFAVACFSIEAAIAKAIGPGIDLGTIGVMRGFVQFIFIAMVFKLSPLQSFRTDRPRMHIWRGFLTVTGMVAYFYAFASLPLAVATVILFTGVLFSTLAAQVFLREVVGWRRWSATLVGFAGVVIVARPGSIPLELPLLAALYIAMNAAAINVATKGLTKTEPTSTIMGWIGITMLLCSIPIMVLTYTPPTFASLGLMVAIVVTGTVGQYASITAYRLADVSSVTPIFYLRIVIAAVIGYVLFNETIDALTLVGGVLVTFSALYTTLREAKLARERARFDVT
jgi:drug/metabolite transporter (DMT)-like permease